MPTRLQALNHTLPLLFVSNAFETNYSVLRGNRHHNIGMIDGLPLAIVGVKEKTCIVQFAAILLYHLFT